MEPKYINLNELKGFVEYHKLMNRNSITQFRALVTIQTAKNKITKQEMNVGMTFELYEKYTADLFTKEKPKKKKIITQEK